MEYYNGISRTRQLVKILDQQANQQPLKQISCMKLIPRNLYLGGSPGFAELIRVAHCVRTICPNSMVYAELQLSSWESGIWVQARHRVPV